VVFLFRIRKACVSNLVPEIGYTDRDSDCPEYLLASANIGYYVKFVHGNAFFQILPNSLSGNNLTNITVVK
jgi:hypothetical protein